MITLLYSQKIVLHNHQYKFVFVKLFYLFDLVKTRNLVVYKFWHAWWDLSTSHLILLQRKKSSSSCYQLQWPLARTFKFKQ